MESMQQQRINYVTLSNTQETKQCIFLIYVGSHVENGKCHITQLFYLFFFMFNPFDFFF